jgi:hypothetical protein
MVGENFLPVTEKGGGKVSTGSYGGGGREGLEDNWRERYHTVLGYAWRTAESTEVDCSPGFEPDSKFKQTQIVSNLNQPIEGLPKLKKWQIK